MNSFPQNPQPTLLAPQDDEDSIDLLELLDVVLDQRWLVAGVTALVLALGGAYAFMTTPVFEANSLIQVEDSKGGSMNSLLGDMGSMFDIKSPATAEIEILRSRLVVGQAVSNLQLDLSVTPKYLPLVGQWLARRAKGPSTPGFLGLSGYVSGTEALQVGYFKVPQALEGERFTVALGAQGYNLESPDGAALGQGRFGEPLVFKLDGAAGELLIASAIGQPGAEFYLSRASQLAETEQLQKDLNITEQGKQSGVISVSLEGTNPALTARTLNEIGSLYVRQNVERKAAEAEKSISFLNTQLPQLRKELETSEGKFNQFRNQNGTFDLTSEAKAMLDQAVNLKVKLLELQQKRKELESRFTAQHPTIQVLDGQIKDLGSQIGSLDGKAKTFPNVEQDLLRLTRDVKVNNELYTGLLNSFQQLRLVKEGKVGNVRIVDVAAVPEKPVKPKRAQVLAIAGVLGLLAGLALAFLRNSLRPGIKNADDIEQHLGLHVFATVPHSKEQAALTTDMAANKTGMHLLANTHPEDPGIESLRSLRTALQFAMLDAPNNVVLVSGATPGIGKSFTSANFAAVLGAGGKRVLLVDADMRKGHIHKFFGLPRGKGLSELIAGSQPLAQVLHKSVSPQVDLITTGTLPPNPAELLMSPATVQLLQTLASQYDMVLIDTPPVLAVSDTQVLAPQAGTVFLVARSEVSTLGELQESAKRLKQSGVATRGVIFNDVNTTKRRYGYGYKYSRYRYTQYQYGQGAQK
ncbi:polysaccharide biosynthesis tyrosine autokinase [Rhodoferax sp.]|uniref:polysaccharide biosynthesis tyrosine autokinase n=1 Tax=Rhodoferax sp. TaxID=50421 RepID=UPI00261AF385|nr:polysaccharide biosynthesis tyrosine autokinase [Rhodoferax sp.]MDD3934907.1 polysaccharide biosynthesis tyrosine autokinase [Rhodoferax sp.]